MVNRKGMIYLDVFWSFSKLDFIILFQTYVIFILSQQNSDCNSLVQARNTNYTNYTNQ